MLLGPHQVPICTLLLQFKFYNPILVGNQYSKITAKERVTEEHNTENSKFSATRARFAVSTDTN